MVLANQTVARMGVELELPFLYRIHEDPDPDKLEDLREMAGFFGHTLPPKSVTPPDLRALLEACRGEPHEYLVSTLALRSMRRARYAAENVGHFGLGLDAYLHFTSPIRRYPDLVVHRALVRWMRGSSHGDPADLQAVASHASARERRAEEAERESLEAKKIRYMERHVGDEFEGTISGVTSFGLFVALDSVLTEGLVRLSALEDDYYRFDPDSHSVTGRRTRRRYRLGDRIAVRVVRVDTEARKIDLEPCPGDA